jgi:hypothetical protein
MFAPTLAVAILSFPVSPTALSRSRQFGMIMKAFGVVKG